MDTKNQSDKEQEAVTEEQAAAEVMKYADKVSQRLGATPQISQ